MNERIIKLITKADTHAWSIADKYAPDCGEVNYLWEDAFRKKFAELIVEAVLDEVKERAYYTGDRDWSDEVDRPWIQLEFGYGSLADAKKGIFK